MHPRPSSVAAALLLLLAILPAAGADPVPPPVEDTYVYVGGDAPGGGGAVGPVLAAHACLRVGVAPEVNASASECWQDGAAHSRISRADAVPGEIIVGVVVMGQPVCLLIIKEDGAHTCSSFCADPRHHDWPCLPWWPPGIVAFP